MSYSLPKATSLKNTQKVFLFAKESTFAYSTFAVVKEKCNHKDIIKLGWKVIFELQVVIVY